MTRIGDSGFESGQRVWCGSVNEWGTVRPGVLVAFDAEPEVMKVVPETLLSAGPSAPDVADSAVVAKGRRDETLRDTAFEMARGGATNHEILARLAAMSEAMGKYTDRNLFEKWTRLLAMIRQVRRAGIRVPDACVPPAVGDRDPS